MMEQCTSSEHGSVPVPTTVTPSAVAVTLICAETLLLASESTSLTRGEREKGAKGFCFFLHSTFTVCLDTADRVTGNIQAQHDKINCDSNGIMLCSNKAQESDGSFTCLSSLFNTSVFYTYRYIACINTEKWGTLYMKVMSIMHCKHIHKTL